MVTGQRFSRGFYGSLYEGEPGVSSKTFLWCGLSGFSPQTPSEELSVLLVLLFLGLLRLGDCPFFYWFSFSFILVFTLLPMSTCKFHFLGWRLVLSAHT